MLLPGFDEAAFPFIGRALALALNDVGGGFRGRRLVQLLDEASTRTRSVFSFGVHRSRVSAFAHGQSASFRSSASNAISFGDGNADFATSFTRLSSRS